MLSWRATAAARSLRKIDTTAVNADILQSKLFGELELDADSYADLFDNKVQRVSPLRPLCVVAVASTKATTYLMRRVKPSSSVSVLNVGTDEPAYSQTRKLISQPV